MMPQEHPLLDEESASVTEAAATEVSLLDIAVLLMQHKRFIMRFVLGAAVLAAAIAMVLPVTTKPTSFCYLLPKVPPWLRPCWGS